MSNKKSRAWHIETATAKHNGKYDYSNLPEDLSVSMIVDIVCDCGNPFKQKWSNHRAGRGCKECADASRTNSKRKSREEHLSIAIKKHGDRYDYSNVPEDVSDTSTINIRCTHCDKSFDQTMNNHKSGHGCSCNKSASGGSNKRTLAELKQLIDDLYGTSIYIDYDKLTSFGSFDKLDVTCTTCNTPFYPAVNDFLRETHHCPVCSTKGISAEEVEILDYIKSILPSDTPIISGKFDIIAPLQLDIFIPDRNIAIEYCGLYWHTDKFRTDKNYHKNKFDMCADKNIKLLTIFSDEWVYSKEIVKQKLANILGVSNSTSVFARKCDIRDVPRTVKKDFFDANHIQGNGKSSINYGLYYDDVPVAIISFKKHATYYELTRFATSCNVPGAFSKLMKYTLTQIGEFDIVTFADLRWGNGAVYRDTGWELDSTLSPDYRYVIGNKSYHKANFRRSSLKIRLGDKFDPNQTEQSNCAHNGIHKIWDCGKYRFILRGSK